MKNIWFLAALSLASIFSACKKEEQRIPDVNYNPEINPANFTDSVLNFWFPLIPGKIYTYSSSTEEVVVTITTDIKIVAGVSCVVVRDVVSENGVTAEDTYDWFATDNEGNVWYFGEEVSNYENGQLADHEGSWEAGIDGAKPGIIMMASPVLEMPYRQEYYFNVAEDWGKLVATGITVTVPYGTFIDCIKTEDWNALEPDAPIEYKYYAPGVGLVKEEVVGGSEVLELISID